MRKVVIVAYKRTPFSRSYPTKPEKDVFNAVRMDESAALLIKEMLRQNKLDKILVDRCIFGCASQMGEQWLYGGRTISILADLPYTIPTVGIDVQCGSSMAAVHHAAMEISLGYSEIVFAGGLEHMTHNPMRQGTYPSPKLLKENRFDPRKIGKTVEDMYDPQGNRYFLPSMGDTAELLAKEGDINKEEMDKWAERSHHLAAEAQTKGFFHDEIMPLEVEQGLIDRDISVRGDTSYEKIASLPPAFVENGLITAGNSSPLNAGAAMVLLMTEEKAKEFGFSPMASIVSLGWGGVDPLVMGKGPVPSSIMALNKAGLSVKDIDFWEINEAFAVVPLWAIKELGLSPDRVNVRGGAIALGHPLGATGARIVGTLARILQEEGKKYGVATACIGGGQGLATVLERYV